MRAAGENLDKACSNSHHGLRLGGGVLFDEWEHDPKCSTCHARSLLSEHDHLHLGREVCEAPGLNGVPGKMVKCKCGAYHH